MPRSNAILSSQVPSTASSTGHLLDRIVKGVEFRTEGAIAPIIFQNGKVKDCHLPDKVLPEIFGSREPCGNMIYVELFYVV